MWQGRSLWYRSEYSRNQYQLHLEQRIVSLTDCWPGCWPLQKRTQMSFVTMQHKEDIWEVLQKSQLHRRFLSWVYTAQLGLIYAADKAVSLQHSTLWGTLGETAFQFISDSPSPWYTSRVFKAVKSIDQHLKLGPTPCPSWEDMVTSPVSPHYSLWPPALLATLTFWYNYD